MPRGSATSRKSWSSKNPAKPLVKMQAFALDMDDLLSEIENLVQALRFMGHGMEAHHADQGYPISAVACTAAQRLVALREIWKRMIKASVRS
jgi:L-fucose mutarotase/ribose pyranase (RbsD/FucU family)